MSACWRCCKKSQGNIRVIGIHLLRIMNACTKVHGIHPVVVEIFPSGPKYRNERQQSTDIKRALLILLSWLNKEDQWISSCIFSQLICCDSWIKIQSSGLERKYLMWILQEVKQTKRRGFQMSQDVLLSKNKEQMKCWHFVLFPQSGPRSLAPFSSLFKLYGRPISISKRSILFLFFTSLQW